MIETFTDTETFLKKAGEIGVKIDLRALLSLDLLFFEQYKKFVVINLRGYDDEPNNLMVLSYDNNLLYSAKHFTQRDFKIYSKTLEKKFGESTVLALLITKAMLHSYQKRFAELDKKIDRFETRSDLNEIEETSVSLRRLTDRVEDFLDVLLALEDRKVAQVRTNYVGYDYDVLIAHVRHLLDRCRNHVAQLRELRSDIDARETRELNKRLESLTSITKRLTALAAILMVPTIIASIYGMNFANIPLYDWEHGFIFITVLMILVGLAIFFYGKKKDWI